MGVGLSPIFDACDVSRSGDCGRMNGGLFGHHYGDL